MLLLLDGATRLVGCVAVVVVRAVAVDKEFGGTNAVAVPRREKAATIATRRVEKDFMVLKNKLRVVAEGDSLVSDASFSYYIEN